MSSVSGEVGTGGAMAETGQESVAQCCHSTGGRAELRDESEPRPSPATPCQAEFKRRDGESYPPHLSDLNSMVSLLNPLRQTLQQLAVCHIAHQKKCINKSNYNFTTFVVSMVIEVC